MDYSDSDGDIPEVDLSIRIQPYMFEPVRQNNMTQSDVSSNSDNDSEESDGDANDQVPEVEISEDTSNAEIRCSCDNCIPMPTQRESKCCRDTNIVDGKIEEADLKCITEHEGFIANCLNRYVIETSYFEFRQENGPLDEQQKTIHEIYRFIRWIYQVLGKRNRRILPSCVVTKRHFLPSSIVGLNTQINRIYSFVIAL